MDAGYVKVIKMNQMDDHGRIGALWGYINEKQWDQLNIPDYLMKCLKKIMHIQNMSIVNGQNEGRARVAQQTLADSLGLSVRAVREQILKLERLGIIEVKRSFNSANHRNEINQYSFTDWVCKIFSSAIIKMIKFIMPCRKKPEAVNLPNKTIFDRKEKKTTVCALSAYRILELEQESSRLPIKEGSQAITGQERSDLITDINIYSNYLDFIPKNKWTERDEYIYSFSFYYK